MVYNEDVVFLCDFNISQQVIYYVPPASTTRYFVPGSKVGFVSLLSLLDEKVLAGSVRQYNDAASGSSAITSWLLYSVSIRPPCKENHGN